MEPVSMAKLALPMHRGSAATAVTSTVSPSGSAGFPSQHQPGPQSTRAPRIPRRVPLHPPLARRVGRRTASDTEPRSRRSSGRSLGDSRGRQKATSHLWTRDLATEGKATVNDCASAVMTPGGVCRLPCVPPPSASACCTTAAHGRASPSAGGTAPQSLRLP